MSGDWKRCSTCKKPLPFDSLYYVCSVSTCNRKRTGLFFCSVECWEVHLPMARHREAWAVEETAPSREGWNAMQREEGRNSGPQTTVPSSPPMRATSTAPIQRRPGGGVAEPVRRVVPAGPRDALPEEVLVVVSRFKAYVKARHDMNTSDGIFELLSVELRRLADEASDHARLEGRKTLLDRDLSFLRPRKGS